MNEKKHLLRLFVLRRTGGPKMSGRKTGRTVALLVSLTVAGYLAACGGNSMGQSANPKTAASEKTGLEPLFSAVLQYRSQSERDAVVSVEGREGVYIGSGDDIVTGDRLRGTLNWSLWSGNCLYPLVRSGQSVPDGLHVCTMNPAAFIQTEDGARIRFDGRGYGVRRPDKYRIGLTLVFGTEDDRYAWLTKVPGVLEGEFDEKAGRATWNVYVPAGSHP